MKRFAKEAWFFGWPAALTLVLAVWFLGLGLACGGEPAKGLIEGPDKVDPYRLVELKISGTWEAVKWRVEPRAKVDLRQSADGAAVLFVGPPGIYTARVVAVHFAQKRLDEDERQVVIGTPEPPKPPDPPLPPGPQPGGKYQLMFLFQSDKLDNLPAGQREILASLKFRKELEAKGHLLRGFFDVDSGKDAPPELAPFFAGADGASLPCVRASAYQGGTIKTYPLPADEAAMWKFLEGGVK